MPCHLLLREETLTRHPLLLVFETTISDSLSSILLVSRPISTCSLLPRYPCSSIRQLYPLRRPSMSHRRQCPPLTQTLPLLQSPPFPLPIDAHPLHRRHTRYRIRSATEELLPLLKTTNRRSHPSNSNRPPYLRRPLPPISRPSILNPLPWRISTLSNLSNRPFTPSPLNYPLTCNSTTLLIFSTP